MIFLFIIFLDKVICKYRNYFSKKQQESLFLGCDCTFSTLIIVDRKNIYNFACLNENEIINNTPAICKR